MHVFQFAFYVIFYPAGTQKEKTLILYTKEEKSELNEHIGRY